MMKKNEVRAKAPAKTRELLLAAAAEGFARSGFSGASIDSIVAKAGFTKGAFYANFESKEALLLELLHVTFEKQSERADQLLKSSDNLEETLRGFTELFDEYESHTEWVLLSVELQLQAARDPEFGKRFEALYRIQRSQAGQIYRALFHKAGKRPPDDFDSLIDALIVFGQTLVLQNARRRHTDHADASHTPGYWYSYFQKVLIDAAEPLSQPGREESDAGFAKIAERFGPELSALTDGSKAGNDAVSVFLKAAADLMNASR